MSDASICYSFDPTSGVYLGFTSADPSPEEDGIWLYPAHTTTISPPEFKEKQVPVWDIVTESWSLQADHRGETWWRAYNDPVSVTTIGNPEDEGFFPEQPDAPPLPEIPVTVVSKTQFAQQLVLQGDITENEAFAYLQRGEPPAIFETAFQKITDSKLRFMARSKFIGASEFDINNEYTKQLIPLLNKDEDYAKNLWQNASKL